MNTLKLSADEGRRNGGEVVPFDAWAGSTDRQGWFTREPLDIIVAITPYNDPLNLVAHELGPAIVGGNAVILKPSELAPLSAIKLVTTLVAAGMPTSVVTVATGGPALGEALVSARDVRMVSFTGGNAPAIVPGDCDLEDAVDSCVSGAYWAAGQNCIGTQRILVQIVDLRGVQAAVRRAHTRIEGGQPGFAGHRCRADDHRASGRADERHRRCGDRPGREAALRPHVGRRGLCADGAGGRQLRM